MNGNDYWIVNNSLFKNYIDITFDENDFLLFRQNNNTYDFYNRVFEYIPPSYIISKQKAYNDYVSKYFDKNPNEKRRSDIAILEFKKNIEIAKEKKEKLKEYFIKKYGLNDDINLTHLLKNIINIYLDYSKKYSEFINIVAFLQNSEIQSIIIPLIEEYKMKQQKKKKIKFESITSIKGPNEKNKDLYKIVENMIADKEEKLNVKINEANDKLKELSGLDNDEIESVINDVMIIIKDKINNKTEELELKEKIIQFLNPAQTGDLINLID